MKLTIGDYEVEVKARHMCHDRTNAADAKAFLNHISSSFFQASLKSKELGWEWRAEDETKMAADIYDALDAKGYYDNVKKNA